MSWLKTSRSIFMLWLLLLLYVFSSIDTNAYNYTLWVSRKYYSGSNAYVVGTWNGSVTYEREYFTGLGYCTWYYYVNHNRNLLTDNDISLARQVLQYDSGNVYLSWDYINLKLNGWSTAWETNNLYGPLTDAWFSLFRFNILKKDWSPFIPLTYTLGRFRLNNYQSISGTNLSLYYLNPSSVDASTYIKHTNSTFNDDADRAYNVDIVYYAQPCIPDTPIISDYTEKINGNADGQYTLARVPAFNFESNEYSNPNSWRPFTLGYTDFTTANFIPGNWNTGTFNHHISFDSGIYLAWIKEPDISSQPNESFYQWYYYNNWTARYSWFSLVDNTYVTAPALTSNQRWINPDTISVTLTFTGVDKTDYRDKGEFCMITITGETNLWLIGDWTLSWNRNELSYSVHISSGTIRTLAKQQCPDEFATIDTWNIDLKRETVANIQWDAWDYAHSMIISQNYNTESYTPANQITGPTGYAFNSYSANPVLSMATNTIGLSTWSTGYNVPIDNQNLLFTGTDVYAGIHSGTFVIVVSGYESSVTGLSNTRRTSAPLSRSYTFSGNDVSAFAYNLHHERYDYTWLVDFATKVWATTGTHFTVSLKASDFVGNTTTQNYIFRTPTWPNRPKWSAAPIIAQTKNPISPINFINNINQDTIADWVSWSNYNYLTYYPSSSGLINNFSYISGWTYINDTTGIILEEINGNAGAWTTVTLTGLTFNHNGASSSISGTPYISSWWEVMLDYVATDFTFEILATNIYGITWIITYTINVAPSCTESAGCTDPVYVFRWLTKADAMAQESLARAQGIEYLKANHRYPHWFAEIKQTGPNFYFTGNDQVQTLYCASSGNNLLINYWWYSGPQGTPVNTPFPETYTGNNLTISGGTVQQFGVFTASVSADYTTGLDGDQIKMTIFVNRPLSGRVFYSVCEFTGGTLDVFGCPVVAGHNWTGDVNWTKMTGSDTFITTGWIEWGWLTGNWNGSLTGGSLTNGNQFDFWSTGMVYDWWWYRLYSVVRSWNIQENINTSGNVSFAISNRTWANSTVGYEIYWIDNTVPEVTSSVITVVPNKSRTLTLSGTNTGQLTNSQVSDLIWDDEYVITSFINGAGTDPQLFEAGVGSPIHTGSRYINGTDNIYKMVHTMTFASNRTGDICMTDRAGNESCIAIEVLDIGNLTPLIVTVRPAFRPDPATNDTWYSILSWDFWFFVASGSEWIQNYNSNTWDPKITTNKYGTGIVSLTAPESGALYLVVFKWPWTLSAGFTGIWNETITEMNFFTWTYAQNFSSDFVYKFNNTGTIEHYLKVGDTITNTSWAYDYIADTDFSAINNNLTIGSNSLPFYRYDFDINNVISSMEQSMILQARASHWFIWRLATNNILPIENFVSF